MSNAPLSVNSYDPETAIREIATCVTNDLFVSEDGYFISEFFMTYSESPEEEGQTFFCLLSEDEGIGSFNINEVGVVVTTVDGTDIEFSCCGEIQMEFEEENQDEIFTIPYSLFTPINFNKPDIDIKIEGLGISVVGPQEFINKKWLKLATTPIAIFKVLGSEGERVFKPNPTSDIYQSQNVFIEHLKALDEAKDNFNNRF